MLSLNCTPVTPLLQVGAGIPTDVARVDRERNDSDGVGVQRVVRQGWKKFETTPAASIHYSPPVTQLRVNQEGVRQLGEPRLHV